jgi:phosphoglycolate phosphatase
MRILLFDIDGTLLWTHGGQGALQIALTREFGLQSACANISFSGRTDRSLLAELLERNDLPNDDEHLWRLRRRYVSTLPGVLSEQGGKILPGAAELLSRLSEMPHIRNYVMTGNLQQTATHKLDHFDLLKCVDGIFGGDLDSDRDDLARRSACVLRQRYGPQSLDDAIVIGDTPADIRCGHAIGAKVVAVCTGRYDRSQLEAEDPMHVEEDLSDVDRLIQLLTYP